MIERADGVVGGTVCNQQTSGGSIPASALFFRLGETDEGNAMVSKYHYSHRPAANVQYVGSFHTSGGLFGNAGPMVAACFFSIPPTRWSEPVLELSRLVRGDCQVPLTKLISLTLAKVRADRTWDLAVSFADFTQKHLGGVYRAANWRHAYDNAPRMTGLEVGGEYIPGRSSNLAWGTSSPSRLAERGIAATPIMDDGKRLFWYPILKSGNEKAKRLGLIKVEHQ